MAFKPLIGVTACVKEIGLHPYHVSGDKYLRAVSVAAEGLPLVIPSLADLVDIQDLLHNLDGLLFTGSPSMSNPSTIRARPANRVPPMIRNAMPPPYPCCARPSPPAFRCSVSAAASRK